MRSHPGPQHHPRVSTCDVSSPEVSRRCTVVLAELVKPPVQKTAWTSPPTQVWKVTEWQIYEHCKAWWADGSLESLATCPNSELRRRTIGSSILQNDATQLQCLLKVKAKTDIAFHGNPISELRDVTCHMGSHSVTCHPTQVNVPHLVTNHGFTLHQYADDCQVYTSTSVDDATATVDRFSDVSTTSKPGWVQAGATETGQDASLVAGLQVSAA